MRKLPEPIKKRTHVLLKPGNRKPVLKIPPGTIAPLRLVKIRRLRDVGVRGCLGHLEHLIEGITDDLGCRHILIQQLIHKRAVGAVLQKPPDEIRQKITVCPRGCINAAGVALLLADQSMQRFAHAVQTLKLKGLVGTARQRHDGRDGVGVMGGKLRIKTVTTFKEFARAHEIRKISACLAGKHRISLKSHHLGALDLGIPVSPFDQPDHDLPLSAPGERIQPVDHRLCVQVVGLHHHPESVPTREGRLIHKRLDHIQGEIQPLALLGVNIEAHRGTAGELRQGADPSQQFGHDPCALAMLKTRVQCRELYRDAGILLHRKCGTTRRNCGDGF